MLKNIILIIFLSILLIGCQSKQKDEKWTSWIYPDKLQTKRVIKNGIYNSLKECKSASIEKIKKLNVEKYADFKCGLNCTFNENLKTEVCQKMIR
ncbi:hypothetical protein CRV00_00375 [Malaciobacter molluscorum]|uniref:hypothetical protein n=1 Tax=Malaciobacter molluscorum TaxID=1032072 RepID=UPI00100AB448|nr:hypothetical protein [Malaciobacter molluscorum]RXJ97328.1 hypothetical protein CRV00_00375 [Malaciobacter molluscorum]